MNKKGLLGSLIGAFIMILVVFTLLPIITQQLNALTFCNQSNQTDYNIIADTGTTNSFGGGGTEHFGGYDGKVVHSDWMNKVGEYSIIDTNKSIVGCLPTGSASATVLGLIPGFFAIGILFIGIAITWNTLRYSGMI